MINSPFFASIIFLMGMMLSSFVEENYIFWETPYADQMNLGDENYQKDNKAIEAYLYSGDDVMISGTRHSDTVYGEQGDDEIGMGIPNGGENERDVLHGGEGRDKYRIDGYRAQFDKLYDGSAAYAIIEDFDLGNAKSGDDYDGDMILVNEWLHAEGRYSIESYDGEVAILRDGKMIAVVRSDSPNLLIELDSRLQAENNALFVYE